MDQWFHADDGAALDAFRQTYLALNPHYTDVQFFDAARGGSALLRGSAEQYADTRAPDDPVLHERISENYWFDEVNGIAGPNLALFADRLQREADAGTEFQGVIWAQGEADTTYVGSAGAATYTAALEDILAGLLTASGAARVYIQGLGDRAFYSEDLHGGTGAIRAAQQSVAEGSDAIELATTIFDQDLRDTTHLTDAGYEIAAQRMAVAISTGEASPAVEAALLVAPDTLLVQFDLAVGQRASGAFDLGGFALTQDGADPAILSATLSGDGLLRIETAEALTSPVLSYGSARESVHMAAADFLYVAGPNGTVPILPFDLALAPPRHDVREIEGGLRVESGRLSESIAGLSGDDILYGNAGHDTLDGGWGSDTLYGGDGSDVFMLGEDPSRDIAPDFDPARDFVGMRGGLQSDLVLQPQGEAGVEILGPEGQRLLLPGVAPEEAGQIRFQLFGSDGANVLTGDPGDDRIFALGGDDVIDSGSGYDRITTGDGADGVAFGTGYGTNIVYDFDLSQDSIRLTDLAAADLSFRPYKDTDLELRTEAGDRLVLRDVAFADRTLLTIADAPPAFGVLTGTEGADVLRGTSISELFEAFAGTDRLYGGGGEDVFVFAPGSGLNVVYDFEDGHDRILVSAEDLATLDLLPYKDSDAEIRLASGDRMVLRDTDLSALDAADFISSVPPEFL